MSGNRKWVAFLDGRLYSVEGGNSQVQQWVILLETRGIQNGLRVVQIMEITGDGMAPVQGLIIDKGGTILAPGAVGLEPTERQLRLAKPEEVRSVLHHSEEDPPTPPLTPWKDPFKRKV